MREHEQWPNSTAAPELLQESFAKQRNELRAELLQKILPSPIDQQRLFDFLGGNTVTLVKQRMKEFPLILGGTEIEHLGNNLRNKIRSALFEQFGENSYLRNYGGDISDESEVLTGDMYDKQVVLQKAYWRDSGVLLGDNLGLLRMSVLSYKVLGEASCSISEVVKKMLETDIEKRIGELEKEIKETPDWLERKGLPKNEPKSKNELSKRVDRAILDFEKDKVEELTSAGVHRKIAEVRVLSDSTKAKELTSEEVVYIEKRLEKMRRDLPQLQEEYERLKQSINVVISEILNEPSLDHIMQICRFSKK